MVRKVLKKPVSGKRKSNGRLLLLPVANKETESRYQQIQQEYKPFPLFP
jgi:hypothetical protein